jgi:hypothetical protein
LAARDTPVTCDAPAGNAQLGWAPRRANAAQVTPASIAKPAREGRQPGSHPLLARPEPASRSAAILSEYGITPPPNGPLPRAHDLRRLPALPIVADIILGRNATSPVRPAVKPGASGQPQQDRRMSTARRQSRRPARRTASRAPRPARHRWRTRAPTTPAKARRQVAEPVPAVTAMADARSGRDLPRKAPAARPQHRQPEPPSDGQAQGEATPTRRYGRVLDLATGLQQECITGCSVAG